MSPQAMTVWVVAILIAYAYVGSVLLQKIQGMTTYRAVGFLLPGGSLLLAVYARIGLGLGWGDVSLGFLAGAIYLLGIFLARRRIERWRRDR